VSELRIDYFDELLKDEGPAAIVLKRKLKPVEGDDSWIFPPTFAQSESSDEDEEGRGGSYQIDPLPDDSRRNVCLIDSVGSQANRIEPIFKQEPYSALVPQIRVKMRGDDEINLLDAGHRAADAVVRFSKTFGPSISEAFKLYQAKRDCTGLIKIAPTSLVFGVWDSRATGAKIQRIIRSVIRAYNVTGSRRSATFQAAYDYTANLVIDPALDKGSGKNNSLSQEGFKYSLATNTHGGVTVKGGIQQEAVINLVALRVLSPDIAIKRYLLGLALVALSYRDQNVFNLREGCLLCAESKADLDGCWRVVCFDGTEINGTDDTSIFKAFTHQKALAFAMETIKPGTGVSISHPDADAFDKDTAEKWLAIDKKKRKALAKTKHPAKAIADEAVAATKKAAADTNRDKAKKGEDAPGRHPEAEEPAATNEDEAAKDE
jgi:CRISPR-associated protein Csb1